MWSVCCFHYRSANNDLSVFFFFNNHQNRVKAAFCQFCATVKNSKGKAHVGVCVFCLQANALVNGACRELHCLTPERRNDLLSLIY